MKYKQKFNPYLRQALSAVVLSTCAVTSAHAVIEEVVVTANKRAQNANDIGLSIASISGDKLKEQKLTTLDEITSSIPGLEFSTSQQGTPILTLRGVGFNESSIGVYPATSLYVDEIPLPFPVMAAHSAYDLERVEVLKGPQGVLFGQNSTGGAINFIAAKPSQDAAYGGSLSYGRFNQSEINAYVTGGLSDSVSGRIAVQSVQADEWQQNPLNGDENGEEDYTAIRASLRFDLSDAAEINVNINGWRDKSDPQAFQSIASTSKGEAAALSQSQLQASIPLVNDNDAQTAFWTGDLSSDKEFLQTSIRGDFDLSDTTKLTTLLAYSDYEQDQVRDGDGSPLVVTDYVSSGEIESTFAEIRLAGADDGLSWVIGANYEDSSTHEDQLLEFFHNSSSRPSTLFLHRVGSDLEQEIESYAVFGNVDFNLSDDLVLKAGARFTDTTIDANSCNYAPINNPLITNTSGVVGGSNTAALFNLLPNFSGVVPGSFTPIGTNDCFSLNENNIPGFPFKDELSEDNVSWRLGVDYQLNDDILVYANLSKGYKAGSYPTLAANGYDQLQPVIQESVLAYEVGFKASMADNTIQWNAAIFHYDYEDKQIKGKIPVFPFGPLEVLVNVPESTITGLESDVVVQLSDSFTLTAAVTYLDSNIDTYTGFDVYGVNRDLSDNDIPFTPELSYSIDLDYRTELSAGGTLFMGVHVLGKSDSDSVFDGDDISIDDNPRFALGQATTHKAVTENYFVNDGYTTVGARLGYESAEGQWSAMLWGKNLTDEYYWDSVIAVSEGAVRVAARPRTYGVSFSFNY